MMHWRGRKAIYRLLGVAVLALFLGLGCFVWYAGRESTGQDETVGRFIGDPSPETVLPPTVECAAGDLSEIQRRVRATAEMVLPTVVAVASPSRQGAEYASGVIVSPEGIVLSQWHVSHWLPPEASAPLVTIDRAPTSQAGTKTTVILHDGRSCPAELLGTDRTYDLSLLRILTPGPYPYAPIRSAAEVQLGEWVLKIGHPLGYCKGRAAPIRLGRVLHRADGTFDTDCMATGGDSGGPFFSLDGTLLGILGSGPSPGIFSSAYGWTLPKMDPLEVRRAGLLGIFQVTACRAINSVFDSMAQGEGVPWDMERCSRYGRLLEGVERLRLADWSQGSATLAQFRCLAAPVGSSVVVLRHGGVSVALGTIVGADGWIVSKASELPAEATCQLPDGQLLPARVVGADLAFDLALLKVAAKNLRPVVWAETSDPPVGTLVVAAGPQGEPLAMGIVSVRRRDVAAPERPAYTLPLRLPAGHPEIYTSIPASNSPPKTRFLVHCVCGVAWAAGVRPGDVLRKLDGRRVRNQQDLAEAVKGRLSGDVVSVDLERGGKALTLQLPLRPAPKHPNIDQNYRADGFPTITECAVPFFSHECGGPIVDLSGRAIGVTIAHVGNHGGLLVPADCVQRLLSDLRADKQ